MRKISIPIELDSESGECLETFEARLAHSVNVVKSITNPYVGNKRKILYWLVNTIEKSGIKYDSVLDLFSGSAVVSMVMKLMNKKVICNDLLYSSYMYSLAFVENNKHALLEDEIEFLLRNNNSSVIPFVQIEYLFRFTKEEAKFLDNFKANVEELFSYDNIKRALAFVNMQLYIMEHCFVGGRLNNGQVLAELKHRLQHARNNGQEMNFKNMKWRSLIYPDNVNMNKAYWEDAVDFLPGYLSENKIDLIYIDPPYGDQQSNYAHMFHFFESYLGKNIDDSTGAAKRFSQSKGYEENFVKIIELTKQVPAIAISYNNSSWENIDKVTDIVKSFRSNVEVHSVNYDYQYRKPEDRKGIEYLILAR
jgi:adenine-specific DNA methylase